MHTYIEALESRIAPAGVVKIQFASGLLTIQGDNESSTIAVISEPGQVTILAPHDSRTQLEIAGSDTRMQEVTLQGDLASIKADLAGGSDTLFVSGPLKGIIRVKGGEGNDELGIHDAQIKGSVSFNGGDGEDSFGVTYTQIKGSVSFDGGNGNDEFFSEHSRISGDVALVLGSGDDFVSTRFLRVDRSLYADLGNGANEFEADGILSVHGTSQITAGSGDDSLWLYSAQLRFGKAPQISLGSGHNRIAWP